MKNYEEKDTTAGVTMMDVTWDANLLDWSTKIWIQRFVFAYYTLNEHYYIKLQ